MKSCIYKDKCGGCQYQGVDYNKQLEIKQLKIEELFKDCKVERIQGMDNPIHYRHKVFATFSSNKQRKVTCGIYEENSHRVVPMEDCLIQNEKANKILISLCDIASKMRIAPYNEDKKIGVLRHAYIRVAYHTNEILLVLVLGNKVFPGRKEFIAKLRQLHPEITTCLTNINTKQTSMVLGEQENVLFGKGTIQDILCGVRFQISSQSFYQVNPEQTEKLYSKAIEMADITKNDSVLDAYCGIGTISLIAAKSAKEVVAVEVNKTAVKDAIFNAKLNSISNAKFIAKDATEFMYDFASAKNKIDVAFIDPPRAGSDEKFLLALSTLKPAKIIYVSCNPVTQKRDVNYLKTKGYELIKIQPVDMFPFTEHIETIALLQFSGTDKIKGFRINRA